MGEEFRYIGDSTRKRAVYLSILSVIEAILVVILFRVFNIEFSNATFFIFLFIMALLVLFMIMLNISSHNKFKKQRIRVFKTHIMPVGFVKNAEINFEDIEKIDVIRTRLNEVAQIVVKANNGRLRIYGFENMDRILDLIQDNKVAGTEIIDANINIIWKKPIGLVFIIMTMIFIIMLAIKIELIRYLMILIFTIIGLYVGILIKNGKLVIIHTDDKFGKANKIYGLLIISLSSLGILASALVLMLEIYIK